MSILQSLESLFNTDASSEEFAWYADLLLSQGDAAKALEVLEHGLESHPDLLTALLVKSKCLDQLGQIDEAIQLCAHILEIDDRCLAARVYLYHNALKQGQNAAALKIHQRIVLQDPWTTIPAPEANTSTPIAAAAVAAPLAFAAPPLVDDLFGEESIADELFENPPIPDSVAAPIQATPSADDLGPLNLGENLPSSEEVGMAFESLFGASGVDEILPEPTAELDLGDELSEPIIAQDPTEPLDLAEPAQEAASEPYLDLAPEDVGQAFDELFGDEGLGSLPEELPLVEASSETQELELTESNLEVETLEIPEFSETALSELASAPELDLPEIEVPDSSDQVMEISIVDAHADLLDFGALAEAALQSELFAEIDSVESEEPALNLDQDLDLGSALSFDGPEASIPEQAPLLEAQDLESGFDQLFADNSEENSLELPSEPNLDLSADLDLAPILTDEQALSEISPLEAGLQALEEAEESELATADIFGHSDHTEALPFFEGEAAEVLDQNLDLELDPAMDDIFALQEEEQSPSLLPELEQAPFELVNEDGEPLDEEQALTASQASGQTITLAEIYCSQGLFKQALSIYQSVLAQKEDETLRLRYAEIEALLRQKESGETEA